MMTASCLSLDLRVVRQEHGQNTLAIGSKESGLKGGRKHCRITMETLNGGFLSAPKDGCSRDALEGQCTATGQTVWKYRVLTSWELSDIAAATICFTSGEHQRRQGGHDKVN